MDKALTVEQAAQELGYSTRQIYRLLTSGRMKAGRFGKAWMIDRSEVERVKALQGPGGRLPKRKK